VSSGRGKRRRREAMPREEHEDVARVDTRSRAI
jgi:hypothetical protein